MSTRPSGSGQQLVSIQILRGLAALQTVWQHALEQVGGKTVSGFGVDLFFVISGFVMVVSTPPDMAPSRFILRRIVRIVPLYWIATSLMLALYLSHLSWTIPLDLGHILSSYAFLPTERADIRGTFPLLAVGWTLNFEMLFYVIFAASLWLPAAMRQRVVIGLLLLMGLAAPLAGRLGAPLAFWFSPIVWEFGAGMLLAGAWQKGRSLWPAVLATCLVVGVLCGGLAALSLLPFSQLRVFTLLLVLPMMVVGLMLELRLRQARFLTWLRALGDASYSLYLFHVLAIALLFALPHVPGLPWLLRLVAALAVSVAAGLLVHRFVERPVLSALRGIPSILRREPVDTEALRA